MEDLLAADFGGNCRGGVDLVGGAGDGADDMLLGSGGDWRALGLLVMLLVHERSHAAIGEFKREHPCPATGLSRGACPGWVIDHIRPLACGGPDAPANMQWQRKDAALAKDRVERRECRRLG